MNKIRKAVGGERLSRTVETLTRWHCSTSRGLPAFRPASEHHLSPHHFSGSTNPISAPLALLFPSLVYYGREQPSNRLDRPLLSRGVVVSLAGLALWSGTEGLHGGLSHFLGAEMRMAKLFRLS
jgi:hypothetical protein